MAYLSKRTGEEIDALLDKVEQSVVDTQLSTTSTNAIANSTVTKALNNKVDKVAGKGLSTNDYTNEEKERVKYANDTIPRIERETKTNTQSIEEIRGNAVKPEDYYPKMSVGFADNLIGRGEATAEEFTYRPTNGKDPIEDEVARVTKIKGNSVVWNQLFTPIVGTFTKQGLTFIIDETGKVKITGTSTSGAGIAIGRANIVSGRKYLYTGIPKDINGRWWWSDQASGQDSGLGVITTPTYPDENRYFVINVTEGTTVDITFYPKVCDLTKMFSAGNEPTTVGEFYARIPSGIDINAYTEGEIISVNTEAIKAVGFNQFNGSYARVIFGETYYLGGTYTNIGFVTKIGGVTEGITIPEDKLYKATRDGYIYAEGRDICINLSHTGWKNGTYEPYREFTRELPVIKKYFPDGMKKAGNAFDSIEWDSIKQKWVAVQRIGVVDLGDLRWSYSYGMFTGEGINVAPGLNVLCTKYHAGYNDKNIRAHSTINGYIFVYDSSFDDATAFKSAMQGVMLYYELAEPIVTEIEEDNLNFDYDAEDFGTEEALSSIPSAPFSADIIYKFNAVDSIRQNRLDIKALQEAVLSLQSQIATMQVNNIKEE